MYKTFLAIAVGSLALSAGIVHFDPDNDAENGRYREGVLPAADAKKAADRGLIEIGGDATKEDYDAYLRHIAAAPVGEAAAARVQDSVDDEEETDDAAVSNIQAIAYPNDVPARTGESPASFDPDAPPLDGDAADAGGETDPVLKLSIPKMRAALAEITDAAELDRLHSAEEAGRNRDGALAAIDDRKSELAG